MLRDLGQPFIKHMHTNINKNALTLVLSESPKQREFAPGTPNLVLGFAWEYLSL